LKAMPPSVTLAGCPEFYGFPRSHHA